MCGEHYISVPHVRSVAGSSPRVRGTHGSTPAHRHRSGIIPACAGNTRLCASALRRVGDHPRVCGEHVRLLMQVRVVSGSSPRVRGTLHLSDIPQFNLGIIPACAGNTTLAENPP